MGWQNGQVQGIHTWQRTIDVGVRIYPIIALIALISAAICLWGSMATVHLARTPGMYSDNIATWAYFQFVLFVLFALGAAVAALKAWRPKNKAVIALSGSVVALFTLVSILGVLMAIVALMGRNLPEGLAVPVLFAATGAAIAVHWGIVRRGGVHATAAIILSMPILAFGPIFFLGPILFCSTFTPHIRCL